MPERLNPDDFFKPRNAVVAIEHYPTEFMPRGTVGRAATWDRITFALWSPRRVWLGGRERLGLGDPSWHHLPSEEVAALIGRDEMEE